jgi:hypothetical protein
VRDAPQAVILARDVGLTAPPLLAAPAIGVGTMGIVLGLILSALLGLGLGPRNHQIGHDFNPLKLEKNLDERTRNSGDGEVAVLYQRLT